MEAGRRRSQTRVSFYKYPNKVTRLNGRGKFYQGIQIKPTQFLRYRQQNRQRKNKSSPALLKNYNFSFVNTQI